MAGGKGKSIGGKGTGAKESTAKSQKSHSAKAGLQVCCPGTTSRAMVMLLASVDAGGSGPLQSVENPSTRQSLLITGGALHCDRELSRVQLEWPVLATIDL